MSLNEQCEVARFRHYVMVRNVVAACLAFLVFLLGWFVNQRLAAHHVTAADAVTDLRNFSRRDAAIQSEQVRLENERSRLEAERQALRQRLSSVPDEARIVAALSRIAAEHSLAVQSMRPVRRSQDAGRGEVDVQVVALGSYDAILRFLDSAAKMPRVCHVAEMSVIGIDESGDKLRLEVTFGALFGESNSEKAP